MCKQALVLICGLIMLAPCGTSGEVAGSDPSGVSEGWHDATRFFFGEAQQHFAVAQEREPGSREAKLGSAVSLLNVQPRVASNIEAAASLLEQVRTANPADELGITATYLLARLEQLHRFTSNKARAIELYQQLLAQHPEHPLSQLALVKVGMLQLYGDATAEERRKAFEELERRGAKLSDLSARRDFHLMMASAAARLALPETSQLSHLLEAERAGVAKRKTAADLFVRIGEVARRLGQDAVAAEHYRRFLQEFAQDNRCPTIRERLRAIEQGSATATDDVGARGGGQ
jgi:tetratricopeptide (TPR) repeat protein